MRFGILIISCFFIVSAAVVPGAAAKTPADLCDKAESTADHMACTKKRFDEAQDALNAAYDSAVEAYKKLSLPLGENEDATKEEPDSFEGLKKSQSDWISYRDGECERQVASVEIESLKRLKRLSCEAALTEQRTTTLLNELEEHNKKQALEALETVPKWMNVLARENPDIFWRYGERLSADLNCDARKEEIISGIQFKQDGAVHAVLAIADNPRTGRPQAQIFSFPVQKESAENALCSETLKFSVVQYPQSSEETVCEVALQVDDNLCASYTVLSQGGQFALMQDSPETPAVTEIE